MTVPKPILNAIQEWLEAEGHAAPEILSANPVLGGDINEAFCIATHQGDFFLKYNDASAFPGMFEAEASGLELLANAQLLTVPRALHTGKADSFSFLLSRFEKAAPKSPDFWEHFGRNMGQLHQKSQENFGLDHNNYIGSLPQSNAFCSSWGEFFVTQRLEQQCRIACDNGAIDQSALRAFDRLFNRAETLFPEEPPALLHGDLWSGNFMVDNNGEAAIIDPAVYFGHREMDLGMTKLFGSFSPEFYRFYEEENPLEKGWEGRLKMANLYPLMVHVNLFGGSYLQEVMQVLRAF